MSSSARPRSPSGVANATLVTGGTEDPPRDGDLRRIEIVAGDRDYDAHVVHLAIGPQETRRHAKT
jgi:hypothetical protein